jgi:ABC-type multidrug transport system ATPase subunit
LVCGLPKQTTPTNRILPRYRQQADDGHVERFSKDHLDFVPQFDILPGVMTVHEVLMHAARLKAVEPENVLLKRVAELLTIVGMRSRAHALCGNLTGGESKRVSIAKGLVANPKVCCAINMEGLHKKTLN